MQNPDYWHVSLNEHAVQLLVCVPIQEFCKNGHMENVMFLNCIWSTVPSGAKLTYMLYEVLIFWVIIFWIGSLFVKEIRIKRWKF